MKISRVQAREILDSRGNPDARSRCDAGRAARSGVPPCPRARRPASREALELRDGDPPLSRARASRRRSAHVNGEIAHALEGRDFDQRGRSTTPMLSLDGTPNKGRLGANALLGVSMAAVQRRRGRAGVPLYAHLATLRNAVPRAGRAPPAGADDEHPERRRARRQQRGLPGVHGDAARRAELPARRCAGASRSFTRSAAS